MAFSPWALRNVLDNHQRAVHPGLEVFLRIKNDEASSDAEYATYGFQVAVTGAASGVSDIPIEPPPDVVALSEKEIASMTGAELRVGAHSFLISHTWVMERMELLDLKDPYEVFRGSEVVGLFYHRRVFSIDQVLPEDIHNETISWRVIGNMLEPEEEC